jgi:hypothetical protein
MNWQTKRGALKHLGTLHGTGNLLIGNAQDLGPVVYEIDGYARRAMRSDNGQINGSAALLAQAFNAGAACIILADGQFIDVELANPRGGSVAEIMVKDRFPQFDHAA